MDDSLNEWQKCLELLTDPTVSEIEANGPNSFYMKKNGQRVYLSEIKLNNKEKYARGVQEFLIPMLSEENRSTEFLCEGPLETTYNEVFIKGRTHIVLPPVTDLPQVTIAKKTTSLHSLDDIAFAGSMSQEVLSLIRGAIAAETTMVFSGATGAGKTTFLEACSREIPDTVRIGVAEDTPELVLRQNNVTYLHSHPWRPGMDVNNTATLSWVVQQFMRMRIDRLIVGETRGVEFGDFLTAANSGVEGSMTTIHANSPVRCLDKMANFAMRAFPSATVRTVNLDIGNAVDFIVQLRILPNGKHKVDSVEEVTTTVGNGEDARITTQTLYKYNDKNDTWTKKGHLTDAMRQRFESKGVNMTSFNRIAVEGSQEAMSRVSNETNQGNGLLRGLGGQRQ